jgi:hypothetical protein
MTEEIAWYVELTVKTGQLANFLALTGEMVEATRAEEGVLSYQRFVTEMGNPSISTRSTWTPTRPSRICGGSSRASASASPAWSNAAGLRSLVRRAMNCGQCLSRMGLSSWSRLVPSPIGADEGGAFG